MNAISLLGTTVVTNKGRSVLLEDTYPKGRVCGKTTDGEFVVLSLDFVEQDMTQQNLLWSGKAAEFSLLNSLPESPAVELDTNIVFVQEVICGGPNAAGGGCGAPLGVSRCYTPLPGDKPFNLTDFSEHNDDEVPGHLLEARNKGYLRLRLVFRQCGQCRVH